MKLILDAGTEAERKAALDRLDPSGQVRMAVKDGPVPGVFPAVQMVNGQPIMKLLPAHKSAAAGRARAENFQPQFGDPDGMQRVVVTKPVATHTFDDPVNEVRRTARERFKELAVRLMSDGQQYFKVNGEIVWPESIKRELDILGIAQGGRTGLSEQVEALAGRFIHRTARQQQRQDSKRVTRGWHGHLSI